MAASRDGDRRSRLSGAAPDTGSAAGSGRRLSLVSATVVAAIVTAGYSWLSLLRYFKMQAGIDLALYTQAVQGYSNLHWPISDLKGGADFNLLGDHFTPVVALAAPVYRVCPHAWVLLLVQAVLVGFTVFLVARAGMEALGTWPGLGVALVYGLAWGTQGLALYEFHEVAFALPMLALVYTLLLRERYVAAALWALPLMLVKEDSVFLILGVCLVLLARRRFAIAALLGLYAATSFALIVAWIIPSLSYYGQYTYWSSSAAADGAHSIAAQAIANVATASTTGAAPLLLFVLLAPTLGVALRSPLLLGVLPPLVARFTAPDPTYWGLWFHYNGTLAVVIVFAAIDGVRRLSVGRDPRFAVRWAVAAVVATGVFAIWAPGSGVLRSSLASCGDCETQIPRALRAVPDYARVAAPHALAAYLVDRTQVFDLHEGLLDSTRRPIRADYIVVDRSDPNGWQLAWSNAQSDQDRYKLLTETRSPGSPPARYDVAVFTLR